MSWPGRWTSPSSRGSRPARTACCVSSGSGWPATRHSMESRSDAATSTRRMPWSSPACRSARARVRRWPSWPGPWPPRPGGACSPPASIRPGSFTIHPVGPLLDYLRRWLPYYFQADKVLLERAYYDEDAALVFAGPTTGRDPRPSGCRETDQAAPPGRPQLQGYQAVADAPAARPRGGASHAPARHRGADRRQSRELRPRCARPGHPPRPLQLDRLVSPGRVLPHRGRSGARDAGPLAGQGDRESGARDANAIDSSRSNGSSRRCGPGSTA